MSEPPPVSGGPLSPEEIRFLQGLQSMGLAVSRLYESVAECARNRDYVGALSQFKEIRAQREEAIALLVHLAREQGASWRDVGEALGLHRSSAQQRFGRNPDEA